MGMGDEFGLGWFGQFFFGLGGYLFYFFFFFFGGVVWVVRCFFWFFSGVWFELDLRG